MNVPHLPDDPGSSSESAPRQSQRLKRRILAGELLDWGRMFASAAVYATLIVTFVGQVAADEGAR